MPHIHVSAIHAKAEYNNNTPGIGVLCELPDNKRLAAGTYYNSYYRQSYYGAIVWQPLHLGALKAGPLVGLATGYKRDTSIPLPIAAFAVSLPIGKTELHLSILPSASDYSPAAAELSFSVRF